MTALVTGASGGDRQRDYGALAAQGARLALSGSNAAKLRASRDVLNDEFGHDHVEITCDLSNTEQVEHLVPTALDTLGKLDISSTMPGSRQPRHADEGREWDAVIRVQQRPPSA